MSQHDIEYLYHSCDAEFPRGQGQVTLCGSLALLFSELSSQLNLLFVAREGIPVGRLIIRSWPPLAVLEHVYNSVFLL